MEKGDRDLGSLLAALAQMGDQLRQLDACLDDGTAHSPPEQRKRLVLQARFSFDRIFWIAKAILPARDSTATAGAGEASSDRASPKGHKRWRSARRGSWLSSKETS